MSHPNARLTVHARLILVGTIESGWPVSAAARAAGVSRQHRHQPRHLRLSACRWSSRRESRRRCRCVIRRNKATVLVLPPSHQ